MSEALISIENLSLGFRGGNGEEKPILRNINLTLKPGETLGIVGESGSGKSTVALAMMGFMKPGLEVFQGHAVFDGHDMFTIPHMERAALRGNQIALIPQNAGQALTPTMKIGAQIEEALLLHTSLTPAERGPRVIELLNRVRLPAPEDIAKRYPHELSGGQQQRVAIAMALGTKAKALLLDEPTTGLDVTTQAHILEFLRNLAKEAGVAMVYVSHDLGVIARVTERIAVMYAGEIVEEGTTRELLKSPAHPYPRALLASIPRLGTDMIPASLPGFPPPVGESRKGCAFAERCAIADQACHHETPAPVSIPHGSASCLKLDAAQGITEEGMAVVSTKTDERAIETKDLAINYFAPDLLDQLTGKTAPPDTVSGVSFTLNKGETLGLVGESGSGKSTILRALAGLKAAKGGHVLVGGNEIEGDVSARTLDQIQPLQMIFQNADSALNPRQSIREILDAPLRLYFNLSPSERESRLHEIIDAVRLPASYLDRYPGQLSGGEKQRIGIARAFAADPDLVLCDEVTSALDVSVQAAALALLKRLQETRKASYVFVSHDLAVVRALSDQIAVLYQGRICEIGPSDAIFAAPFHPYTETLLGAILEPDPDVTPKLLVDDVSEKAPPAVGCPFQRRCAHRITGVCDTQAPPVLELDRGHKIMCHLPVEALSSENSDVVPEQA